MIFTFCLGSYLISYGLDLALSFKVEREIADSGYFLKRDKSGPIEFLSEEDVLDPPIIKYIPILNVARSVKQQINYENNKALLIEQLKLIDAVDKMSPKELYQYKEEPSIKNLRELKKKRDEYIKSKSMFFYDSLNDETIYFDIENKDIEIKKVESSFSDLNDEDYKEIIDIVLFNVLSEAEDKDLLNKITLKTKEELNEAVDDKEFYEESHLILKSEKMDEVREYYNLRKAYYLKEIDERIKLRRKNLKTLKENNYFNRSTFEEIKEKEKTNKKVKRRVRKK